MNHPEPAGRRRSPWITAAAVLLLLVVAGLVLSPSGAQHAGTAVQADSEPKPASASPSTQSTAAVEVPAGPVLIRLAASLADAAADTAPGAYSYVALRNWSPVSLIPPGDAPLPIQVQRVQLWQNGRGSGRRIETTETGGCQPSASDALWSGHPVDPIDTPAEANRAALQKLFLDGAGPGGGRPVDISAGIAALAERQALRRPVRAMVLLLLADVPGLLAREQMRDRAGRPSIEVILPYTDTQGTPARYMLAFDPGTGVLLASWTAVTGPSVSPDPQRGPVDLERQRARIDTVYRLYVTSTFASSTETPAGGCPSPTGAR